MSPSRIVLPIVLLILLLWALPVESAPLPEAAPAALGDTLYFGGTFWNADSLRWEALAESVWTFDTGVGSDFNHDAPGVDPRKDPSRHALMEGWVGWDYKVPEYSRYAYFRRMSQGDYGDDVCVGSAAGLGGSASMWAGATGSEADSLHYAGGQGYGNRWKTSVEHVFAYDGSGLVSVEFSYTSDMDDVFDNAYLLVDYPGGSLEELTWITGTGQGTQQFDFTPPQTGPFTMYFEVYSNDSGSDQDGLFSTPCGAFAFDDISVTGGGNAYFGDFETGDDGWVLRETFTPGGEYSDLVALADIDSSGIACTALQDTVLTFTDDEGSHPQNQENYVISPWINLKAMGAQYFPRRFVELDVFSDLADPLSIGLIFQMQYYPYTLEDGSVGDSPWYRTAELHFLSGVPDPCGKPHFDLSEFAPAADRVRIAVGMASYNCPSCGVSPITGPWIDNIRFGVVRTLLSEAKGPDQPADAFPSGGATSPTSTARVDGLGGGDTLVVVNVADDIPGQEVEVVFAVDPGPGINASALTTWLTSHAFVEHARGLDWYSARMDTAEVDGAPYPWEVRWMTCYHEDDPNFSGSDTSPDPSDSGHLLNDIFPDDLLTPGTRLSMYYRSRTTYAGNSWVAWPDTGGGTFLDMDVLPSSTTAQGTNNPILYVDGEYIGIGGEGASPVVEAALAAVLHGGSSNAENQPWDRCDHLVDFNTLDLSLATPEQLDAYETIIWTCGDRGGIDHADAALLDSWLTSSGKSRNLFLSGSRNMMGVLFSGGHLTSLAQGPLGADTECSNLIGSGCPPGTPQDNSVCFELVPEENALAAGTPSRSESLWMPKIESLPPLALMDPPSWGSPSGDEHFQGTVNKGYASVVNIASGDSDFHTVLDCVSLHNRYQGADCSGSRLNGAVQRLLEVLTFFGYQELAVPGEGGAQVGYRLSGPRPNPLSTAAEVSFEIPRSQRVLIRVYDIQGRLVQTLLDKRLGAGPHTVEWDGRNHAGAAVSAGVYFYQLTAGSFAQARKVMVVR